MVALICLVLLLGFRQMYGETASGMTIDRARREIRFSAVVQPKAMEKRFGVRGHHAIVWREGKSAPYALFRSDASDREVRRALEALGAVAGENLTAASWNLRNDRNSLEPDKRVEGTPVEVFVEWQGSGRRLAISELVEEKGLSRPSLDLRYGGNERFQPEFQSGCIVCLYSCPGGAIGNHAHPIRDYVRDGVVYSAIRERLPRAGTHVTIILRPRSREEAS